jgi:hypothetical protein
MEVHCDEGRDSVIIALHGAFDDAEIGKNIYGLSFLQWEAVSKNCIFGGQDDSVYV